MYECFYISHKENLVSQSTVIKDDIYDDFSKIYQNLDAQALFIQSLHWWLMRASDDRKG